jgi:hypothetical protein
MTELHQMLRLTYNRILLLFAGLAGILNAQAQTYNWQASVATPQHQGYHRIQLSREVTGALKADFSDVRIVDASGKEVPYLLRTEQPVQYKQLFRSYDILSYTHQKNCCSELVIANPGKRKLNNISLLVSNADARKQVKLSGSDNQQDWYVLKEQDILYAINNQNSTAEVKLLNFPLSDYRYFRLQLNDSSSAPLNILKAGYYDTYTETGKYTAIPVQQVTRKDSAAAKSTYIHLRFAQPVYPDRLELTITAPQLYYRHGYIQLGTSKPERRRRSRRRKPQEQQTVNFVLSSNAPAIVELPRRKIQELTIVIQNADNQPLNINAIKPLQLNHYLVADLSPEQSYTLKVGNTDAKIPDYELAYFQDSIPADLPLLQTSGLKQLQHPAEHKSNGSNFIIWAAIGLVVVGLGYMTVRLLNDMDKEKQVKP